MHIKTLYQITAVCFKQELVIAESPVGLWSQNISTLIEVTQTLEAAGFMSYYSEQGGGDDPNEWSSLVSVFYH